MLPLLSPYQGFFLSRFMLGWNVAAVWQVNPQQIYSILNDSKSDVALYLIYSNKLTAAGWVQHRDSIYN